MGPRRKTLTAFDREAWAAYAQKVHPLPGKPVPEPPPPPPPTVIAAAIAPTPTVRVKPQPSALAVGQTPAGVDRATWNRLRGGRMAPARTLDLHGRTAQAAFHALTSFLFHAHAEGLRCVEVITGRGSGEAGGVIRREFPLWLNRPDLRGIVLAASHPHPANPGSVRLLLRRTRSESA